MRHANEGTLRRLLDEPWAIPVTTREHVRKCPRCAERLMAVGADQETAAKYLSPAPAVTGEAALEELRKKLETKEAARTTLPATAPRLRRNWARPVAAAITMAVVAAGVWTPIGSYAKSVLLIFEPQSVTAVPIAASDLRGLAGLRTFGLVNAPGRLHPQVAPNLTAASAQAGYSAASPGWLPSGIGQPVYAVLPAKRASFTFSQTKLAAYEAKQQRPLPPLPADLANSTLFLSTKPAVVTAYGLAEGSGGSRTLPKLIIAQIPAPQVFSSGASVNAIENYLTSLPGVSPTLAAEIRAIGDPASTLPIPVPVNLATSQAVTVQGAKGLAVLDDSGLGSGILWVKDGMVYGVAGSLPSSDLLRLAQALR